MGKHAYLIMAHTDIELLNKLLRVLDDTRNDIFLHIDKKSTIKSSHVYHTTLARTYIISPINVNWGGDTQIKCELQLLKYAVSINKYQYYHLLSGQDLPLKTQDYIHHFFDANDGNNYISIDFQEDIQQCLKNRLSEYHWFQNMIGRNSGKLAAFSFLLEKISLSIQRFIKVNRYQKSNIIFYKGANWFSITHDMVSIILSNEKFIHKYCYHSLCADEIFLQTIAMNSHLKNTVIPSNLRYIDWNRGKPYTFIMEDYPLLMKNESLFARKFCSDADKRIIEALIENL